MRFERPQALDLTGDRFGRLVVLRKSGNKTKWGEIYWLCRCDCGTEKEVLAGPLNLGRTKSCGCYNRYRSRKHGMEGTPTYNAWSHMIARCSNPNTQQYERWGGRGITVCEEWKSFEAFYKDMGDMPKGRSLERIDNDGHYCKENCRWATRSEQNRNRSKSPKYEWNGEMRSLADLAEMHGMKWRRVYERMRKGWSLKDALTIKRANAWTFDPKGTEQKRAATRVANKVKAT
jgi:hypothetical protein